MPREIDDYLLRLSVGLASVGLPLQPFLGKQSTDQAGKFAQWSLIAFRGVRVFRRLFYLSDTFGHECVLQ